jgi:hypothetical protein
MLRIKHILFFGASILLFGCSDTSNITNPANNNQGTSINAYSVIGAITTTTNGGILINSGVNNGAFNVSWNVSSSDPYHVELYLSNDSALSSSTDVKFFSQNCGGISAIYNCNTNGSFSCKFNSQNKISCDTITFINKEKDISAFLNQIPKRAYLIIKACNGLFNNCDTAFKPIELQ